MPIVSVTDRRFSGGALGDGRQANAARNVAAFQAAIDFISGQRGGGIVFVPRGNYIISRAIELKDNVQLRGGVLIPIFGFVVPIIKPTLELQDNFSSMKLLDRDPFGGSLLKIAGRKNVVVSSLTLNGNKQGNFRFFERLKTSATEHPAHGHQNGVSILSDGAGARSEDCLIQRCVVKNCYSHGIEATRARRITVRNCQSNDNSYLLRDPVEGIVCSTCSIHYCGFGIVFSDDTEECLIENCTTFRNPHGGIELYSATSRRNRIVGCVSDSIIINVATENQTHEVHNTISGCTVDNRRKLESAPGKDSCIVVNWASRVTIERCKLRVGYSYGIALGNLGNDNRVLDNTIVGSPKPILVDGTRCQSGKTIPVPAGTIDAMDAIASHGQVGLLVKGNKIGGKFGQYGIRLTVSRNCSVLQNTLADSQEPASSNVGIVIQSSKKNQIAENKILHYHYGIREQGSDSDYIAHNVLERCQIPLSPPNERGPNSSYIGNTSDGAAIP